MSSYQAAVTRLYELGHELARTPSHHFDLANMRVLLRALGNPERRLPCVLVAGTNGKGSAAATLASILGAAGHRTGLYTSPHMLRVNERIRVNSEDISDTDFAALHARVEDAATRLTATGELPWHPSFFEILTAMAFTCFAGAVDIAVLEVGMGGRLDATNVGEPLVAIISDISLDHQKFLGNTIAEIAAEKAGIIRPGGVVVTLPQHPQANEVLGRVIAERGAHLVNAAEYVAEEQDPHLLRRCGAPFYLLDVMGEQISVESPLLGQHQRRNVALAIAAATELHRGGVSVSPRQIERGIRETRWPGRFQVIAAREGSPEYVLDVAHNPAGAWALRAALAERYEGRPLTLVFGVLRDKAVAEITEILFPLAEHVIATQADSPRGATPEEIIKEASRRMSPPYRSETGSDKGGAPREVISEPRMAAALERARALTPQNGVVVITGSIYIVGGALAMLNSGDAEKKRTGSSEQATARRDLASL
jgi:dihydrofolate synthase / folylpolyglutamate synthase